VVNVQRNTVVTGRELIQRPAEQLAARVADDLLGAYAVAFTAEARGEDVGARVCDGAMICAAPRGSGGPRWMFCAPWASRGPPIAIDVRA
jgi:hypothetical protein